MALQGDLQSFALPDVLRLLAGTGKSGLLEVAGPGTAGELSLQRGGILRGAVTTAPRAEHPAEVLFELLRFPEGTFAFAEGDQPGEGPTTDVEFALEQAEGLVREWAEVEAVVPSMASWITLSGDQEGDVHLTGAQWQAIVAVGGGGNVHDLGDALGLSDLDACRAVKDLADAGLVDVRLSHAAVAPAEHDVVDPFESFEPLGGYDDEEPAEPAGMTDLEDLVVEDRPVVMEESEDALLPEPLPGEGVAYDGSDLTGVVDGRTFPMVDGAAADTPLDDAAAAFAAFEAIGADAPEATHDPSAGYAFPGDGGADPFLPEAPIGSVSAISAEQPEAVAEEGPVDEADEVDEERGSLLKFLSTVKP